MRPALPFGILAVVLLAITVVFGQTGDDYSRDKYFQCGHKQYALSETGSISEEAARDILQRIKGVYERPGSGDGNMVDPAWGGLETYYSGECLDEILYYALKIKINAEAAKLLGPKQLSDDEEYYYGHLISVSRYWHKDFETRTTKELAICKIPYTTPKGSYTLRVPVGLAEDYRKRYQDEWNAEAKDNLEKHLPEVREESLEYIYSGIRTLLERFVQKTDPSGYVRKERFDALLLDLVKGVYSFHEDCDLETARLSAGKAITLSMEYVDTKEFEAKIRSFAESKNIEFDEPTASKKKPKKAL